MYSKHYSRMYILNVSYIITVFWKRDCKLMGKKLKRKYCGRLIKSFTNNLTSCRSEIQWVESSRSFVYLTRYFFFLSFFISFFAFFEGWEKTIFKHGFRLIFPLRPFKVHVCLNAHARFLRSFDTRKVFFSA